MKVCRVSDDNLVIYHNLAQPYEGEFSAITGKMPDGNGLFTLDTVLGGAIIGYIVYLDGVPAGIAAIRDKGNEAFEMCEFYVVPCFRKRSLGVRFAHELWRLHGGWWEIKQIVGAEYASRFWRKAIARASATGVEEDQHHDPYWGWVTRQRFYIAPALAPL